jgi:hypothetical protein
MGDRLVNTVDHPAISYVAGPAQNAGTNGGPPLDPADCRLIALFTTPIIE